jgi:hypothetical protein
MPIDNEDFSEGTDDGVAAGWTFSDNCDDMLLDPACTTEPFPQPDGDVSGWRGDGDYELGVSDLSDQSFTQLAGDYDRKVWRERLISHRALRIETEVHIRHHADGDEGAEGGWTAEFYVVPISPAGAEVVLETRALTAGMDEVVAKSFDASPYRGKTIEYGWRLTRSQASSPTTVSAAPLWHFTFDEVTGSTIVNAADPGTRDGTLVAGLSFPTNSTVGQVGNGFIFEVWPGANRYITVPYDARYYGSEITVMGWYRLLAHQAHNAAIISAMERIGGTQVFYGWLLYVDFTTSKIAFSVGNSAAGASLWTARANAVTPTGTWKHYAGRKKADGTVSLFVDGVKQTTEASGATITPQPTPRPIYFMNSLIDGAFPGGGANQAFGRWDESHLFDAALTDDEIADAYAEGAAGLQFTYP